MLKILRSKCGCFIAFCYCRLTEAARHYLTMTFQNDGPRSSAFGFFGFFNVKTWIFTWARCVSSYPNQHTTTDLSR